LPEKTSVNKGWGRAQKTNHHDESVDICTKKGTVIIDPEILSFSLIVYEIGKTI
jgi:hypothetical protein